MFGTEFLPDELIVDLFAGGGGASCGIEAALGRPVDIAINHDPIAMMVHAVNHPRTKHFVSNVWEVDPREACGKRRVGLLWASPDCTHHSRAKGSKPLSSKRRALASVVVRWARTVKPRVIVVENVAEFADWGPLDANGRPDKSKTGRSFKCWLGKLKGQGYRAEYRMLSAADYGTPTTRSRLFVILRRDRLPLVWPEPTHGPGRANPWRTAAECLDFADLGKSIFERSKPLADATMRRIAAGIERYVVRALNIQAPLGTAVAGGVKHAIAVPVLVPQYGGANGNPTAPRPVTAPTTTVTTKDHTAMATAFMVKFFGTAKAGAPVTAPMPTVLSGGGKGGGHAGLVCAFLAKYYGGKKGRAQTSKLTEPMPTVVTKDRLGLVMVEGDEYQIVDIHFRMLKPSELKLAQGFSPDYDLSSARTKTKETALVGNSVCQQVAEALIRANAGGPTGQLNLFEAEAA